MHDFSREQKQKKMKIQVNNTGFESPAIYSRIDIELESSLLQGSVIQPSSEIESVGQEVTEHNWGDSGYNTDWEDA